jgi:hypothetical protein
MAFVKPSINEIKPDIATLSIYLRSVKKFGKSTLFRSTILAKYGDPSYGLLIGCGKEKGYKLLDNLNKAHIDTYKDAIEFQKWFLENPGNVKILCFDTADELCPMFEKEAIRLSNIENPNRPTKSIKGAFGGYMAGPEYVGEMIKAYFDKFIQAGYGVWVIAHSKFKTIKEKGGLDEDGYMQLTSNLVSNYEAAFGDIFDATLTGVIDREYETKGDGDKAKKYATGEVRKLYFRGTTLIDAGSRFADGAVPEYLTYDMSDMEFAELFLKTCEEGMAKSKLDFGSKKKTTTKKTTKKSEPVVEEEDDELMEQLKAVVAQAEEDETTGNEMYGVNEDEIADDTVPFDIDEDDEEEVDEDAVITLDDDRLNAIRAAFKASDTGVKAKVKTYLANYNNKLSAEMKASDVNAIEEILGLNDEV